MKIVFLGTPEFGAIILEGLVNGGYKPVLVITAPDKPVGRKLTISSPPVKLLAQEYGILVSQPEKIENCKLKIENLQPDLAVVAAYGQILPKRILDIPRYGCLNVHPSLLPKYRGSSPIQSAILNGDKETGVTIIKITEKIDVGPVLSSVKIRISPKITAPELHDQLANLGAKLLLKIIPQWTKGKIKPKPQKKSDVSFAKAIKKEQGHIDWTKPADYIERQVRAYFPWPSAYSFADGRMIKILKADVLTQTKVGPFGSPGKTFLAPDDKIAVQTGKDFLIISELQMEGKKPMPSADFLKGNFKTVGTILK